MIGFVLLCLGPAFFISLATTGAMRLVAPRIGLIDQPAARKVHVTPTPLGGGVGIVIGTLVPCVGALIATRVPGLAALLPERAADLIGGVEIRFGLLIKLVAAGLVIAVMGLWDDWKGLPWQPRLAAQLGVSAFLVWSGFRATLFVEAPWVGAVVSTLWIAVLINAFNFLDNMDGLTGGIGFITAMMFATVMLGLAPEPRWLVGGMLLVVAGATAGFLVHNWPPAAIFMGDAGSMFLGLMLASLTVAGTFYAGEGLPGSPGRHVLLAPLCVLAVPLYDFTSVVLIRLSRGRSPFQPDKNHYSHRLTQLGMTRTSAVLTVHLTTLATGLGSLLLFRIPGWFGAGLVLALVASLLLLVLVLETAGRRAAAERAQGDTAEMSMAEAGTFGAKAAE